VPISSVWGQKSGRASGATKTVSALREAKTNKIQAGMWKKKFSFFVSKILNFFQKLCSNKNIFFTLANQRKMTIIR